MDCQNTILDDIAAEIGFTATCVLSAMYGGKPLYIPKEADPHHPLANLIGYPAFRALVTSPFGGTDIRFMPKNTAYRRFDRWRAVQDMLLEGHSADLIAANLNITARGVQHIRRTLEQARILPMVFKGTDAN